MSKTVKEHQVGSDEHTFTVEEHTRSSSGGIFILAHQETIEAFVKTQRSLDEACAPETIYVRSETLAQRLGVKYSPNCGVFSKVDGSVDMLASAGPDPIDGWCGVTLDGRVVSFTADEVE